MRWTSCAAPRKWTWRPANTRLTRVIADDVKDVANVLAYNYRAGESFVSVSAKAGPEIRQWTCENRDYTSVPLDSG